jgi:hypothetical protein
MSDGFNIFLFGLLLGGLFIFIISHLMPWSAPHLYNAAISQCEAELPRNQKCKVIGVIDNE